MTSSLSSGTGIYEYCGGPLVKTSHTPAYTKHDMLLDVLPNPRKSKLDRYTSFLKDITPSDPRELEDMRRTKGSMVISESCRVAIEVDTYPELTMTSFLALTSYTLPSYSNSTQVAIRSPLGEAVVNTLRTVAVTRTFKFLRSLLGT